MNGIVYVLLSLKDHKTYVGSTDNLERRLFEHQTGDVPSTKNRRPLKLSYYEKFETLKEARKKEHYYKSCSGRKKLKIIFNNNNSKSSSPPPRLDV